MNLQDAFLNQVRLQKIPVTVYLTSGHQMKGLIRGFDSFIIMLEVEGKSCMVYKHAVSTVTPLKPVTLFRAEGEGKEEGKPSTEGLPSKESSPDSPPNKSNPLRR